MPEKGKNDIVEFKDFHNYQLFNHLLLLLILKHPQTITSNKTIFFSNVYPFYF